jgi:hypothetical protein
MFFIESARSKGKIPDPGRDCQRFYGAYSNRARISVLFSDAESVGRPAAKPPERNNPDVSREARSTWACLVRIDN